MAPADMHAGEVPGCMLTWKGACRGVNAQVQALVEAGAELDVRDRWSLDPLDEAMRERREPVVKFLQDGGALIGGRK